MTAEPEQRGCCTPDRDLRTGGLDKVGLALPVAGFFALWDNRALTPEDLVPSDPTGSREVATWLAQRGRCEVDGDGRVVGIHGLTLRRTRHQLAHDGRVHRTWCALDAIGIPAALGLDAIARTDCPACRAQLEVVITAGVPTNNEAGVLWLPDGGENLIADFCSHTDLYCSIEHLEERIGTNPASGEVIDLTAAAALGRDIWSDVAEACRTDKSTQR